MQYFVIKIPEEPGLYCFGMYTGREIMYNAQNGKTTQIFDQNNLTIISLLFQDYSKSARLIKALNGKKLV